MSEKKPKLLPDIEDYLEVNNKNIDISGLDFLINKLKDNTDLNNLACEKIVQLFFQEIRNKLLRGNIVDIRGFGRFHITMPKFKNKRHRIFFKTKKSLIKKLNAK